MIPTERLKIAQVFVWDVALRTHLGNSPLQVDRIPEDDGRHDKVQA